MSGKEKRSSKRVQGIEASPPLPLLTRRTKIPNIDERAEGEETTPTAENSPRRKCGFNSQAGKRQPPNPGTAQKHTSKDEDHKGRDSGFADRSQLERTTAESPQAASGHPAPRRPTNEEEDHSSQGSRPSLTWDTSDVTGHAQEDQTHSPTTTEEDEVFADKDLFSPVQNAESQTADEEDEDERYTPLRLWTKQTTGHHPTTDDTNLSYRQLSSDSDKESDSAEGTVGLLTSFNNTPLTPTVGKPKPHSPTQPSHTPIPLTSTTGRPTPHPPTQPTHYTTPTTRQRHPTTNMAAGLLKFKAPPIFSGKGVEDAADWMDRYEILADYNRWTDADKRANFGIYLEGPARQWFQCLTPPTAWGDTAAIAATQQQAGTPAVSGMRSTFMKEFLQDSYAGYQEKRLRNRKQGINEPAAEYYYEVINLCRLMDPNMTEEAKLHHLYEGLKPTLVEKIWVLQPKTCADFLTAVRRHTEAAELACNKGWAVHMLAEEREREEETRVAAASREQHTHRSDEEPSLKQLLEVVQQLQGEIVAMKKRGGRKERNRTDSETTQYRNGPTTTPQRTADGRPICFYCKGEGHIKKYCPKKRDDDDRRNNTTVAMISTSDEENDKEIPLLQIDEGQLLTEEVTIEKNGTAKKTEAIIDTGAAVSIISPKLTAEMALELKTWGGPPIVMVNGQRTPPLGRVELTITIGTTTVLANVLVLEMRGINLLLGNDVLRRFKTLEIEYGTGKPKMRFGELPVRMAIEDQTPTPTTKIIAKSRTRIPARSMAAVEIEQTEATGPTTDGRPWMIEPTSRTTGPTPGRALMPGDRPTVWIMMTNLESRPAYIHKNMVLGHRTEIADIGSEINSTDETEGPRALNTELGQENTNNIDFTPSINPELPAAERKKFEETLQDNIDCFAREGERLGRCNVAEHEIHLTPNARPIYQAQRPTSWKEQAIHRELTEDMLKKGVIEEATGPLSARTLLIQKKTEAGGSAWTCAP